MLAALATAPLAAAAAVPAALARAGWMRPVSDAGAQVAAVRRVGWFVTVTPSMTADLGNLGA